MTNTSYCVCVVTVTAVQTLDDWCNSLCMQRCVCFLSVFISSLQTGEAEYHLCYQVRHGRGEDHRCASVVTL
jgi:hypothetical protein